MGVMALFQLHRHVHMYEKWFLFDIVSLLSVCMSVHPSVLSLPTKNGFHSISFEKVSVLDSYFIQRYIIIEYRSNLI